MANNEEASIHDGIAPTLRCGRFPRPLCSSGITERRSRHFPCIQRSSTVASHEDLKPPSLPPHRLRHPVLPLMKRSNSLAAQTIMQFARQRPGFDPEFCRTVFEHLETASALSSALHHALGEFKLTDLQFGVVVVLYALEPEPLSSADLAEYTAVSRSAVTEALDDLEERELVKRNRDAHDRRIIRAQLTPAGREIAEPATVTFLRAVSASTRYLDISARTKLLGYYSLLQAGVALPDKKL